MAFKTIGILSAALAGSVVVVGIAIAQQLNVCNGLIKDTTVSRCGTEKSCNLKNGSSFAECTGFAARVFNGPEGNFDCTSEDTVDDDHCAEAGAPQMCTCKKSCTWNVGQQTCSNGSPIYHENGDPVCSFDRFVNHNIDCRLGG